MKPNMKTILTVVSVFATAFVAAAQDDGGGPPPGGPDQGGPGPGGRGHHPPVPAIVRALDVNHDGIIDSNEIANARTELLTLDKNGGGQLTRDEYMGRPPGPPRDSNDGNAGNPPDDATNAPPGGPDQGGPGGGRHHHPPLSALVRALDANHDGIIDSNEIANASAELLTLDKNGDGKLTADEYMGKRPWPPRRDFNSGNDGPPDGALPGPPPDDANGDDDGPPDGPPPMDQ